MVEDLTIILLDKIRKEDLAEDDLLVLNETMEKLIDRTNSTFNLVMKLESKYGLEVMQYMQGKEKSPVLAHRRLS